MRRIDNYSEFINEEFFKKIFNKKKPNKSSKKSRIESCLFNIMDFLKSNGINDWNDFSSMSQFDREIINKIIDHDVRGFGELKDVIFLLKLELMDINQLKDYLQELEDNEDYEKCAQIVKKISNKR